jgi:parallel beta-helix repeat protein
MNGTGGYLESHAQWGIGIEGGGDTKVTQNTITGCTTGIQNTGFDGCTIESNTISTMVDCGIFLQTGSSYNNIVNNNVSTTTGDTKHCIYLEGTLNNLHGNFISGATGNGLQVNGNNNTIINNHVFSNTVQGINLNCNGSFVSSNDIYGNTGGLCIEANSWTNIIKGNNLRNNGWAEIYDLGNSTIKIDNIANYVPL